MIATLAGRNLRHHRTLFIVLALGLAGFEVLIIRVGAALESGPGLRSLVGMIPPSFRAALETQIGLLSFASVAAFGYQHPFTLAATIAFVVVAATIPAGERESGFLALLLARSVPRRTYLGASLALVVAGALLLPLLMLTGTIIGLRIEEVRGELSWTRYVPCALGLSTLLLAIGGVALLLAAGARRRGEAISQVVGLALTAYVVEILADLWSGLEWIRWASPFHYFKAIQAAVIPETPARNPAVLLLVFATATALAFVRFDRRDL